MPSHADSFVLALAQLRIEPDEAARNLRAALDAIADGARRGADVVLLPEALPAGWMGRETADVAGAIPDGETCVALRDAARRAGAYVCAGLAERAGAAVYNAAVLVDPTGDVVLHHRKIHELDIARPVYGRGDRLHVASTPWGRIGVMICADAFADGLVIGRTLGQMGAVAILSPCAWAVPAGHDQARDPYGQLWRDSYQPVAREFGLWIAGASSVGPIAAGPWAGRSCIGCSLVVDATGDVVLQGPYGADAECLLLTRVTPGPRARRSIE